VAWDSLPASWSTAYRGSLGGLEGSDPVGLERAVECPFIEAGRRWEIIIGVESKHKSSQVVASTADLEDLQSRWAFFH
jgi:hypothetical protein